MVQSGAGGGGGAAEFDDNSPVPKKEQSQESKTFDYDYSSNSQKKKKQSAEQSSLYEQNKAGMDELPDSSEFIYSLETKTAKKALRNVWKNPQAKKEVLAGLGKMDKGELVPRNQKDLKGFKTLKEIKLTNTRMLLQTGKNGAPDEIVAIFMRRDLDDIGSPKPDQLSCQQLSRFDQQQQFQEAEYPSAVTVEEALKLPDVLTYEAAKKYAEMNLPERLYVNEQHYISEVMAAKKTPHAPEIGLNPVDYGMKAEHVTLIRGMGLYQYLQKGYPLPPLEFIKDYQNQVKGICLESETTTLDDKPYTHNRKTPISIYENQGMSKSGKSVTIVVFDNTPGKGDIITMGKRGHRYMDQVKESGNMGTGGGTI